MNNSAKQVFWSIIDCGLTQFEKPETCAKVLTSQSAVSKDDFHVPEPWNGDICSAKLLFVSINPGFSPGELYPRFGNHIWRSGPIFNNSKVEDFFERRFDLTNQYVTYRNGGHAFKIRLEDNRLKSVRGFWTYVFNMAKVLIPNADPLRDFAITELVHCKSSDISFIEPQCYKLCMGRYLSKIFSIASNVQYVIFIGGSVRNHVCDYYGFSSPVKQQWYKTTKLNGRDTSVVFVDHNNAFADKNGKRAYGIKYPQGELQTI